MAKIALLVGISEYLPEFTALPSPVKDVEAMKEVLSNSEMGGFDDIKVLKNSDRQQIEEAIYELFANRSQEDVLLFYFSGHGVTSQEGNLFLATPKSRKDTRGIVTPTFVGASFIQGEMDNSLSQRLVVIIDCCYSGAFTKGMIAKGDENIDIQAELGGKGRAILMSSSSGQVSYAPEGSELSIYTKYLVEGIKTGAADTDNNGKISADELHQYVSEKVKEESPAMIPQFAPVNDGYRIYLASSPQDDPKLQYRRKVQEILRKNNGNIDFLNRFLLEELCNRHCISDEEAKVIETEEKEPYIQFNKKLKRYENIFHQAVEECFPFVETEKEKLRNIKSILGLRNEDVEPIEKRIISQLPGLQFQNISVVEIKNNEKKQIITHSLESQNSTQLNNKDQKVSFSTVARKNPTKYTANSFESRSNLGEVILLVTCMSILIVTSYLSSSHNINNINSITSLQSELQHTDNIESTKQPTNIRIDYSTLENLLKQNKWREAEKETYNIIFKVSNREKKGWLNYESIANFSCPDFKKIDQLWVKYSKGKFGFSVQKKIYQSFGGTSTYNNADISIWEEFSEEVGWGYDLLGIRRRRENIDLESSYRGQLPALFDCTHSSSLCWLAGNFFSRAETCGL
ncbi:GUN4 domain-containing protein [Okeania sp. SIO2B3]|uniref:caspase, EACC1-associated type n=1 Tax=Okeania sp. SIO2B3 TaxID=2607784 RepID=UPI0013C09EC5|nr:GUN4 domain-containing protein [Okeania sp. SIO2B3]NET42885.1 hypothetical protein [Okeania sp. SIO2B3]